MSAGDQPMQATFWLLEAPDSLLAQSRRQPDGTGLGWFDADETRRIDKRPIAAFRDRRFASDARSVRSRTFVAHVRHASTGAKTLANTHPFCIDDMIFAHNGVIEDLPKLEKHLGETAERVGGETDSERFFFLIWKEIHRHGGSIGDGIRAAVTWVAQELPVLAINFVLATPDDVWALRYPETHSLNVLERSVGGGAGVEAAALEQSSSTGTRVHAEHGREHPLVVIASERMDDDPDWRELRSGELLRVPRTLAVESELLLDGPPAHKLELADLDETARTSQL